MDTPASIETLDLSVRFPGSVKPDTRPGYSGWLVEKENLLEVASTLRDALGYDYLSSVTAVDYLPESRMEIIYHFYQTTGGPGLVFKVQLERNDPIEVPSLVPIYPEAELQEREAWDLFGIRFNGHPDLRRILMWEGFSGHPLRKDWHEAYFEQDGKPFKSRWPDGKIVQAESHSTLRSSSRRSFRRRSLSSRMGASVVMGRAYASKWGKSLRLIHV